MALPATASNSAGRPLTLEGSATLPFHNATHEQSRLVASSQQQPFRFMDLPAELRLNTYEQLLLDNAGYVITVANCPPARPNKSKKISSTILRTCKAVYAEALPVLYSRNTFLIRTFAPSYCTPQLTAYFGKSNAALIRRIFTIFYPGNVLDQDKVFSMYAELGIQGKELHVWAARTTDKGAFESNKEAHKDWLVHADEKEMRRLGLNSEWFYFGDGLEGYWLAKKGSTAREHE